MCRWLIEAVIEAIVMLRLGVEARFRCRMSVSVARVTIFCAEAIASRIVGVMVIRRICVASRFVLIRVLSRVGIVATLSGEHITVLLRLAVGEFRMIVVILRRRFRRGVGGWLDRPRNHRRHNRARLHPFACAGEN